MWSVLFIIIAQEYLYQYLYCSCPLYQIDWVCEKLLADPLMADGYNAIGISQGGLLIRLQRKQWWTLAGFKARGFKQMLFRGLVQRCPIPVKNLITFGSPHQVDPSKKNTEIQISLLAGSLWGPRLHSCYRSLLLCLPSLSYSPEPISSSPVLPSCYLSHHLRPCLSSSISLQAALSFASWWTSFSQPELTSPGFKMQLHQLRFQHLLRPLFK